MTKRFDIDQSQFDMKLSSNTQIKYTHGNYTIVVYATTRFDGCPQLGIYVTLDQADGTVHRFTKDFDGLDYAMAWVLDQSKQNNI